MFSECKQLVTPLVRNKGLNGPNAFHRKILNKTTNPNHPITIKTQRASPYVMNQI